MNTNKKRTSVDFHDVMIDTVPVTYERNLIAALIHSHRAYLNTKESLCPWDSARGVRRPDFSVGHYNMLYEAIATYYGDIQDPTVFPGPIPKDALKAILIDWSNSHRVATDIIKKILEEVDEDFYNMELTQPFIDESILGKSFQRWLSTRLSRRAVDDLSARLRKTAMTLETADQVIQHYKALQPKIGVPHQSGGSYLRSTIRVAPKLGSGLPALDRALGGGFAMGEGALIAGVTGGGKTVMGCQLALTFALAGRKTVYVTTEQTPASLMARMASNYLNAKYELFTERAEIQNTLQEGVVAETKEVSAIPEWMWEDANYGPKLKKLDQFLTDHLVVIDWSDGMARSVSQDFDAQMDKIVATGFEAQAVVFDWLGSALDRSNKNLDLRLVYQNAADHLIEYAKRTKRAMIMFAQLDKVKAMGKPRCGMNMVSECKAMADKASSFIGISAILDQGDDKIFNVRQNLYVEKCREGEGGLIPVQRLFGYQRFGAGGYGSQGIQGGSAGENRDS